MRHLSTIDDDEGKHRLKNSEETMKSQRGHKGQGSKIKPNKKTVNFNIIIKTVVIHTFFVGTYLIWRKE